MPSPAANPYADITANLPQPSTPVDITKELPKPAEGFGAALKRGLSETKDKAIEAGVLVDVPFENLLDLIEHGKIGENTDAALALADTYVKKANEAENAPAGERSGFASKVGNALGNIAGNIGLAVMGGPETLALTQGISRAAEGVKSGESVPSAEGIGAIEGALTEAGLKIGMTGSIARRALAGGAFGFGSPFFAHAAEHELDKKIPVLPSVAEPIENAALFMAPAGLSALRALTGALRTRSAGVELGAPSPEEELAVNDYREGFDLGHHAATSILTGKESAAVVSPPPENASENFLRGHQDGVLAGRADVANVPRPPAQGPKLPAPSIETLAKGAVETRRDRLARKTRTVAKYMHDMAPVPRTRDEQLAHDVVVSRLATRLKDANLWIETLHPYSRVLARLPDEKNIALMQRWSEGDRLEDEPAPVREAMHVAGAAMAHAYLREVADGVPVEYKNDYWPKAFTDPQKAESLMRADPSTPGRPRFTKQSAFKDYAEALAFRYPDGSRLHLRDANPVKLAVSRMVDSERLRAQHNLMQDLARFHLVRSGGAQDEPMVHPNTGEALLVDSNGNPVILGGQRWIVPQGLIAPIRNGLFQGSIWTDTSALGKAFRAGMSAKMMTVPLQLGLSLFHMLHLGLVMRQAHAIAEAWNSLEGKQWTPHGLAEMGKAIAGQLALVGETGFGRGGIRLTHVRDALRGKYVDLNDAEAVLVDHLMEAGFQDANPVEYRTNTLGALRDAIESHDYAKGLGLAPVSAMRAIQYPIMDVVVPFLKLQAMTDAMHRLFTEHPELLDDANEAERRMRLSAQRRNVDQRFGELPYNTLLWNKWAQATMQMSFLSFTWQYGFLKQFGGGAKQLASLFAHGLDTEKSRPAIDSRLAFTLAYVATGAGVNYLISKFVGGHEPQTVSDLVYPVVGHNPDGSPIRVNTQSFLRDFGGIYHQYEIGGIMGDVKYGTDKINPTLGLLADMLHNQNFVNQQLWDPQATFDTRVMQAARSVWNQVQPMPIQNIQNVKNIGLTADDIETEMKLGALGFLGFNLAPKYATVPAYVEKIYNMSAENGVTVHPAGNVDEANEKRRLINMAQNGTNPRLLSAEFESAAEKYQWTAKQIQAIERTMSEPPAYSAFQQLTPEQQLLILKSMPPSAIQTYLGAAHPKAQLAWELSQSPGS